MCGPAIGLIGAAVSGLGSFVAAGAQADAQEKQAEYYDRQADYERDKGQFEGEREDRQRRKIQGQQQNAIANTGFEQTDFAEVFEDSARESNLDVQVTLANAERKAQSLNEQAEIKRAEASATRTTGAIGAISPLIKGFGSALG